MPFLLVAFGLVPFLLTHFFAVFLALFWEHALVSTCGSPQALGFSQVSLDLPESSRSCPFPAVPSTCGHNALAGHLGVQLPTCCPGHADHWSSGSCSTWLFSPALPYALPRANQIGKFYLFSIWSPGGFQLH